MSVKVCKTLHNACGIRFLDVSKRSTSVHLETVESSYEDCEIWLETALAAFDVKELLCSKVSAEACLCDYVITECHSCLGGDNRVAAVCDVCKRTSVDEGCCIFCCLYKIRLDCVNKEGKDRTCDAKFLHLERCTIHFVTEEDVVDASSHVIKIGRKAKDCHDLRCRSDVETGFLGETVGAWSKSCDDASE